MSSSARRLKSEGMITMAARYSINYLWTTFFKRPFTDTYVDIREGQVLPNTITPEPQPEA